MEIKADHGCNWPANGVTGHDYQGVVMPESPSSESPNWPKGYADEGCLSEEKNSRVRPNPNKWRKNGNNGLEMLSQYVD